MIIQSLASNGLWYTLGALLVLLAIAIAVGGLMKRKEKIAHIGAAGWYLTPKEVSRFNGKKR